MFPWRLALLLLAIGSSGCGSTTPWVCDATSCAEGCCTSDGTCIVQGRDAYCGLKGTACANCTTNTKTSCQDGTCQPRCNAKTCTGCCDDTGYCHTSQVAFVCGQGGVACKDCGSFADCVGGVCCSTYSGSCGSSRRCCSGYSCDSYSGSCR